jgi:adenosylcobinamide-phosphate synthase
MIGSLYSILSLFLAFALDLLFGDPVWMPHPVCAIGNLIAKTERVLRRCFPKTRKGEITGGIVLAVFIPGVSFGGSLALLYVCGLIHPLLKFAVQTFLCYQILACKSLKMESMKVYGQVAQNDLPAAQKAVSMIVGRDTGNLTMEGVIKAAVETVAENTSDGVVAPLIFMAVGGAPLGLLYKAINTLDSTVGYKNEKYIHFGKASAKLDDIANFIPARISGILMIVSAYLLGYDGKNAARIFKSDRYNHASPNSAQTESVCAGALDIQLAGDAFYFGKLYRKKTIGDALRPVEPQDIVRANRLLYSTSLLALLLCGGVKLLLILLWG